MATEIERKFLVVGDGWRTSVPRLLRQGYLRRDRDCSVRVRLDDLQGYLTVKGETTGASRSEYEYPIPRADAEEMLNELCHRSIIEKRRYTVWHAGHRWDVDEFLGDNAGLVVAEIELESEDQRFDVPDWLGREVTRDPRYLNANLTREPFVAWKDRA